MRFDGKRFGELPPPVSPNPLFRPLSPAHAAGLFWIGRYWLNVVAI